MTRQSFKSTWLLVLIGLLCCFSIRLFPFIYQDGEMSYTVAGKIGDPKMPQKGEFWWSVFTGLILGAGMQKQDSGKPGRNKPGSVKHKGDLHTWEHEQDQSPGSRWDRLDPINSMSRAWLLESEYWGAQAPVILDYNQPDPPVLQYPNMPKLG